MMEVAPGDILVWQFTAPGASIVPRGIKYPLDYLTAGDILLGDVNDDAVLNILDVVYIVGIVLGGNPPHPAADLNDDGITDILDIIQLVGIILGR